MSEISEKEEKNEKNNNGSSWVVAFLSFTFSFVIISFMIHRDEHQNYNKRDARQDSISQVHYQCISVLADICFQLDYNLDTLESGFKKLEIEQKMLKNQNKELVKQNNLLQDRLSRLFQLVEEHLDEADTIKKNPASNPGKQIFLKFFKPKK